jgi:hypothetical protein
MSDTKEQSQSLKYYYANKERIKAKNSTEEAKRKHKEYYTKYYQENKIRIIQRNIKNVNAKNKYHFKKHLATDKHKEWAKTQTEETPIPSGKVKCLCGSVVSQRHYKTKHITSNKHKLWEKTATQEDINTANRRAILQPKIIKDEHKHRTTICECGSAIKTTSNGLKLHRATNRHRTLMEAIELDNKHKREKLENEIREKRLSYYKWG